MAVESELFGYEHGNFTSTQARRICKFEFANGDTLFFDKIESINLDLQVKLLHMLKPQIIGYMDGNQFIPLDIWVITATMEECCHGAEQIWFRARPILGAKLCTTIYYSFALTW